MSLVDSLAHESTKHCCLH